MRVLVIGSGAREHALVRALQRDPAVSVVIAAPGNAGIAADVVTQPVDTSDAEAIANLAVELSVDLVIIGPEAPLVMGAADAVRARDIACFGPSREAAMLEGSKAFAKQVMASAGVPTAESSACTTIDELESALDRFGPPYVVKDDGLAAGKGVVVTSDRAAAVAHGRACLAGGSPIVVEDYLDGPEVSLFAITDGVTILPLQPAQDFKRVGDGDTGPNTGGMGAYSPLPWAPADLVSTVEAEVLRPTVDEMARRGTPFQGLLYAGLALTSRGIRVVEFNARFGDPETEVVLALLQSPLGEVLHAAATGRLADVGDLRWSSGAAVTVVLASAGYPQTPRVGDPLEGIAAADARPGVDVLHAGTTLDALGRTISAGGRVLAVTAQAETLAQARDRAYDGIRCITLAGSHYRSDIAAAAAAAESGGTMGA